LSQENPTDWRFNEPYPNFDRLRFETITLATPIEQSEALGAIWIRAFATKVVIQITSCTWSMLAAIHLAKKTV